MTPVIAERSDLSAHVFRARSARALPRAHLRRAGSETETIVSLPFIEVIAGPPLSERETVFLLSELQKLIDAWKERNE
jgi:hypothetical protein